MLITAIAHVTSDPHLHAWQVGWLLVAAAVALSFAIRAAARR